MASPAAQRFYNMQDDATKQKLVGVDLDAWYQNAYNAGDPSALKASGTAADIGQTERGWTGLRGQASTSTDWVGKRNPTPSELRGYAQSQGWSEDFNRFDDRQLAAWINKSWDASANRFRNAAGDLVEKPTEGGAQSAARGWATGEAPSGGGRGGGGGGGGAAPAPMQPAQPPGFDPNNPLQSALVNLYQERGGAFSGQQPGGFGEQFGGGGIWWGQGGQTAAPTTVAPAATPAKPMRRPSQQTMQPATTGPLQSAFGQALSGAGSVSGTIAQPTGVAQPTSFTQSQPLEKALAGKFNNPNQWWAGGMRRSPLMR